MLYEQQKKLAEEEITEDRLKEIKEQIKKRLVKKEELEQKLKLLNKEITELVNEGKLENLNDYIKIEPSLSVGTSHIGLSVSI